MCVGIENNNSTQPTNAHYTFTYTTHVWTIVHPRVWYTYIYSRYVLLFMCFSSIRNSKTIWTKQENEKWIEEEKNEMSKEKKIPTTTQHKNCVLLLLFVQCCCLLRCALCGGTQRFTTNSNRNLNSVKLKQVSG